MLLTSHEGSCQYFLYSQFQTNQKLIQIILKQVGEVIIKHTDNIKSKKFSGSQKVLTHLKVLE